MREECFVTEETAGDRIDKFLAEQYEDLSRSFLQKLLKSREVMVNGRPVKASYKAALKASKAQSAAAHKGE